ncbi:hypothetical protein Taro_005099 [Colocasia esculenta]|uniref:Uncharacterized protein n=1 Tax=Colocasia esculenta TaxID=4460 RepID=A0A843TRJ1_COLES|nr:hypothetical protein [Colocasia esculenta]
MASLLQQPLGPLDPPPSPLPRHNVENTNPKLLSDASPPHKPDRLPHGRIRTSQFQSHRPFDEIPRRDDTIKWTSYIARRCRSGALSAATAAFASMLSAGARPNGVTLITLLSACADSDARKMSLPFGRFVHGHVFKWCGDGVQEYDVVLGTSLVDMYAKCGRTDLARQLFDRMTARNLVSWNTMLDGYMRNGEVGESVSLFRRMVKRDKMTWTAMISGYVKNGRLEEALECFRQMQLHRIDPDYVTIISVLAACADLGALGQGLWAHQYAWRQGLSRNVRLSNSLIDMYSRCGRVDFARQVFEVMPSRTLVSWNSMIVGFAINGCAHEALQHFSMMQAAGFVPDGVSFTGVLTACSHAGLVEEGLRYYDMMTQACGISPRLEHYGCLVDMLSRTGRLRDAMDILQSMPMKPNEVVLGSLLAACRVHGDVSMAERVLGYLVEVEPDCDSGYILLSNVYAAAGMWDGVGEVRSSMKTQGIKKTPGISGVEVDGDVHEFVAGDDSHRRSEEIYATLELVGHEMKLWGYVPPTQTD